ncbi:hypothetical protein ACIO1C_34685 [Streptomyces sp. NPDC087420]|uniref:hypothetical protein n=1 Tax=Streptomyces sp. NPDC087420 TaxID=3365785 RepID=UPI003836E7F7
MASADMSGMDRELMWVDYPAGTRLSQSRASEGNRGLVLGDDNALVTHAELFPAANTIKVVAGASFAVGVVVCAVAVKAAPYIKSGLSGLRSKLNRTPQGTASEEAPVLDTTITLERIDGSPARTPTGPVRRSPGPSEDLTALADTAVSDGA